MPRNTDRYYVAYVSSSLMKFLGDNEKPQRTRRKVNETVVVYYSFHHLLFIFIVISNNYVCHRRFRTPHRLQVDVGVCAVCVAQRERPTQKPPNERPWVCAHLVRFWLVKQTIGIKIRNPRTGQSVDKDLIN